jgi:hypothetical protein
MISVTFNTFRRALLDLGLEMSEVPGPYYRFHHPGSGTVLLYRHYGDEERVNQGDIVGARRLLDERGVIAREELEELLRQRSLAGGGRPAPSG